MHGLLLEKSNVSSGSGLIPLNLQLYDIENKKVLDEVAVFSGVRGAQNLRLAADSPGLSGEPIPEGRYTLGDEDAVNGINWVSGVVGNYSGSWGPGLGPAWIGIHPLKGLKTSRMALGIHLDENYLTSPGSAGCVVAISLDRLKHIHKWFINKTDWPRFLVVKYGLGSVNDPFPEWFKNYKR